MKIFDFTNGIKGKQLDEVRWSGSGGWWYNGKRVTSSSTQIGRYTYAEKLWGRREGSKQEIQIKPEDYGVEAICYCHAYETNTGVIYDWNYVPSKVCMETKRVPWQYDDKANEDNRKGMIDDLMECVAFEEDADVKRVSDRLHSLSYEQLKKEWQSLHVR